MHRYMHNMTCIVTQPDFGEGLRTRNQACPTTMKTNVRSKVIRWRNHTMGGCLTVLITHVKRLDHLLDTAHGKLRKQWVAT